MIAKVNFRRGDIEGAPESGATIGFGSPAAGTSSDRGTTAETLAANATLLGTGDPPAAASDAAIEARASESAHGDPYGETADMPPATNGPARSTVLPKLVMAEGANVPSLESHDRPRYREQERLGAGGLGDVTLARDEDIGREVAIKRLRGDVGTPALMRFVDEVQVMGKLDHPNIVPVHDVGCDQHGRLYFVMKRMDGDTLEAIIERLRDGDPETHARYPLTVRVEILMGVLRAVQFAHARRIVHRDIKPSNVMVGKFGEIAVVDWGIAKRLDDPVSCALDVAAPPPDEPAAEHSARRPFRTRVGTLLGTPAYMSPEQARGDNHLLDERTDIFSVSVLFYELLTLQHPFDRGGSLLELLEAVRTQEPTFASEVKVPGQAGIPVELGNVIHRGLAKQREHRFQSVGEMIEELHAVADGTFAITCPATLVKGTLMAAGRFVDKHPVGVALSVVVSGGATVLGLIALGAWAIFA